MIEPSAYGAVVLFGPNTRNFKDVVELLLDAAAAQVVDDADDLTETVKHFLTHQNDAVQVGDRARSIALSQQGATKRTVDRLVQFLSTESARKAA